MGNIRGKGKIIIDMGANDGYVHYMKHVRNNKLPDEYKISRKTYGKILELSHRFLVNYILKESGTVKLPAGLPTIRVKKYKRTIKFKEDGSIDGAKLPPNWPATLRLWDKNEEAKKSKKIVYFINDHTDGYAYKLHMERYRSKIHNIKLYHYKPCRNVSRELAKILLDPYNNIDYYS